MRFAFTLNDICRIVVEKYAPGRTYNARLTAPPDGANDPNIEILVIDIVQPQPPSQPPPPQVTVRSTPG